MGPKSLGDCKTMLLLVQIDYIASPSSVTWQEWIRREKQLVLGPGIYTKSLKEVIMGLPHRLND